MFVTTPIAPPILDDPPGTHAGIKQGLRQAVVTGHEEARRQADRLFGGASAVTTGQQPGLLTGPLYTIFKALSAIVLARRLESETGAPFVPVFWSAGDDHDFHEANHIHLLTRQNEIERLTLRERDAEAPLTPMYREPVGPEIGRVLSRIDDETPDTEFKAGVLEWLQRHYQAEHTMAGAFRDAIADLLGRFGLVVLDASHPAVKQAAAPLVMQALEDAADVNIALDRQAGKLREAGQDVPVAVGSDQTLVLLEGRLGRDRLMLHGDGGGYATRRSHERFSLEELREQCQAEPERFSPNVLLRPVVERYLLPTITYVAGPGELKYLPQAEPLYERFGLTPQRPVPRWSARFVETKVQKVLDKYGIEAEDLALPDGSLESRLVRDEFPDDVSAALAKLRQTLGRYYGDLEQAATGIDPTMKRPIQSARNHALAGLNEVEKKLVAHLKQKNDVILQQIGKARNNIFPAGHSQERILNVAQFLVKYGPGFLEQALDETTRFYSQLELAGASK